MDSQNFTEPIVLEMKKNFKKFCLAMERKLV